MSTSKKKLGCIYWLDPSYWEYRLSMWFEFKFIISQGRQCWDMLGGLNAPILGSIGACKEHLHQAWRPYPWSWSNQSGRSAPTGQDPLLGQGRTGWANMGFIVHQIIILIHLQRHNVFYVSWWILDYLGTALHIFHALVGELTSHKHCSARCAGRATLRADQTLWCQRSTLRRRGRCGAAWGWTSAMLGDRMNRINTLHIIYIHIHT